MTWCGHSVGLDAMGTLLRSASVYLLLLFWKDVAERNDSTSSWRYVSSSMCWRGIGIQESSRARRSNEGRTGKGRQAKAGPGEREGGGGIQIKYVVGATVPLGSISSGF